MRRLLRILMSVATGRDELWRLSRLVKHLPAPSRREIRADLFRRNRRSCLMGLGALATLILPWPAIWLLGGSDFNGVTSPLYFIAALVTGLASVAPGLALLRITAARNLRTILGERRLCIHCGYDLRATPDRCPECGKVPAAAATNDALAQVPADESG